jgi:hypothetical protein
MGIDVEYREGRRHGGDTISPLDILFALHAADYLALPNATARRDALIRAGCPDSLIDLADGTHLDIVEGNGQSTP